MKVKGYLYLIVISFFAFILVVFSADAREGAYNGLVLAESTIIPSLLPLLIFFLMIVKTDAKAALAKLLSPLAYLFGLPEIAMPAVFLGLLGGYPTGAILTKELFESENINATQAQRIMRYNFCGGCGFIITAVGSAKFQSTRLGVLLLVSNLISSLIIAVFSRRNKDLSDNSFYYYESTLTIGRALTESVESALKSVLNITAFIILFSALINIVYVPASISPLLEITNGICNGESLSPSSVSAYLAFGGFCIHLQLIPILSGMKVKYSSFLFFRVLSSLLSYFILKGLLYFFPYETTVFLNTGETVLKTSSVNLTLSVLLVVGCFVLILDLKSRIKRV